MCTVKLVQLRILVVGTGAGAVGSANHHHQHLHVNLDELNKSQRALFDVISTCLDSLLATCVPNMRELQYVQYVQDEREHALLLLATHLTPPSTFDTTASSAPATAAAAAASQPTSGGHVLSFGSLLWLVDYSLKLLHKHDVAVSAAATTSTTTTTTTSTHHSPKKNVSIAVPPASSLTIDTTESASSSQTTAQLPFRSLVVCVLEKTLHLLLTQLVVCDKQPPASSHMSPRDRKIFKRDLNAEIVSHTFFSEFPLKLNLIVCFFCTSVIELDRTRSCTASTGRSSEPRRNL